MFTVLLTSVCSWAQDLCCTSQASPTMYIKPVKLSCKYLGQAYYLRYNSCRFQHRFLSLFLTEKFACWNWSPNLYVWIPIKPLGISAMIPYCWRLSRLRVLLPSDKQSARHHICKDCQNSRMSMEDWKEEERNCLSHDLLLS